jgi:CRISPR system Cascade subunit CasE
MSTYTLTKIEIDHEAAFKAGLRDSYEWHRKIWQAFPEMDGQARDFLTRLDELDGRLRLLLLSPSQPTRPDWCPVSAWDTKPVEDAFFSHSHYQFSLRANPTKKVRSDKDGKLLKNSRRVPIVSRDELIGWMQRKAEQSGFTVNAETIRTVPRPRQAFIKKGKAGLHVATEFIGELRVNNAEKFKQAATLGIGPAKAFGFGMLCLVPLTTD